MAGRPRTMVRKVEGLRERAEALLRDFDGAMPTKYRDGSADTPDLVAFGWQSSRKSIADVLADLQLLTLALQAKIPNDRQSPPPENEPDDSAPVQTPAETEK